MPKEEMRFLKRHRFVLMLVLLVQPAVGASASTVGVTALYFGINFHALMPKFIGGEEVDPDLADPDSKDIYAKIDDTIRRGIDGIKLSNQLREYMDDIRTIELAISLVAADLRNVVSENNSKLREDNMDEFKKSFENNRNTIYSLKYQYDTDSYYFNGLLEALSENVDCSIGSLDEFIFFYLGLVKSAQELDVAYERFQVIDQSEKISIEWNESTKNMVKEFDNQRTQCINKFSSLASKEQINTEPNELMSRLHKRYLDKIVDVLSVAGSWHFSYQTDDPLLLHSESHVTLTAAIFSEWNNHTNDFPLEHHVSQLENKLKEDAICSKDNQPKMIFNTVLHLFDWNLRHVRLCIVARKDSNTQFSFLTSEGSPARMFDINVGSCGYYTVIVYESFNGTTREQLTSLSQRDLTSGASHIRIIASIQEAVVFLVFVITVWCGL